MESTLSSRSELHGTAISKRTIQACAAIGNPCDKCAKPETLSVFEHGLLNQHSFSRRPWFKSQPSQTEDCDVTETQSVTTSPVVLRWLCDSPQMGCARRTTPYVHVARTSNNRVISSGDHYCAYCHGAKLCAHAARDFRSQHCMRSSIVHATPLCWRQYHPTCLQHRDLHMCGWFRTSLGQPSLIHFCIL